MKKRIITKIAASAASIAMIAGAMAAPADSILSKLAPEASISAFAWETNMRFKDSTDTFYVHLDNVYVKNGVSTATEARIVSVDSSKITKNAVFNIPSQVTVSGKDYNGKSFTVTVPVTAIGTSAFYNQKNLTAVKFPSTVDTISSDAFRNSGLVALELPATIKNVSSGAFKNCDGLYNVNFKCKQPPITAFLDCDNLQYFNNALIIAHNPKTGEPILNSGVLNELYNVSSTYITIERCPCIVQYATEYINYIVRTNTNTTDSDIVKARKLHDWLVRHTEYDHEASGTSNIAMEALSPFFHKKNDDKFYAVCAGYAGAYKLLLDAAGIECYSVMGYPISGKGAGHEWNVVNINGNYYHVDTTWDDGNSEPYKYFLRSDNFFNGNHNYNWEVDINGQKKTRSTGVAPYDMQKICDVNLDGKVTTDDATAIQKYKLNLIDFTDEQKMRADVNLDGEISMPDASSIQSALIKMKNSGYTKSVFEFIYIDDKLYK